MPYRRRRTYARRRPFYRRRRTYRRRMLRRPRVRMGFPAGAPATANIGNFRYVEDYKATSTLGVLSAYRYKANGMHDPSYDFVGHQAMGWDEARVYWKRYIVLGSKISATYVGVDGTPVGATDIGIYLSDQLGTSYTSASSFIEAGKGSYRLIPGASNDPHTTKSHYSATRFWGVADPKDKGGELGATTTTDPTKTAWFLVWLQGRAATTTSFQVRVVIDYIVLFQEPVEVAPSS